MDNFHKQPTIPDPEAEEAVREAYEIPEKIGPYKIESLLEIGGMSSVYLGTHPDTLEPITIKTLLPKYASNEEIVERFLNEADIIATADHPNVVRLYGQGKWEQGLYIAMEFIEGTSLRQYLQHNPVSLRRALEIILEIAYALCHLHAHGIIHRDLKLENILITKSGGVKVIDFGIAQLLSEKKSGTPLHSRIIGTPVYMSPEQRQDPDSVSYPSDIYSLGIISYELILGKLSYGRVHLALMPKGLQKILAKALQPKPDDRYQDAVDFITAVSSYMNSSSMEQEKSQSDRLSHVTESLQKAQALFTPRETPSWKQVQIGAAVEKGTKVSEIYYDYLSLSDKQMGIVVGETTEQEAEGAIYTGVLRGTIRTLAKTNSNVAELAEKLNAVLAEDPMQQVFPLSMLCLSPESNAFSYVSCSLGTLWHFKQGEDEPDVIAMENPAIGLEPDSRFKTKVVKSWSPGDTLIYATHQESDRILRAIKESQGLAPQKQAEAILRKIKPLTVQQQRSTLILSIMRQKNEE